MASDDPKVDLIASVSLFSGCGRAELQEIARLVDEIDVPAGHLLMTQGDPGRQMFVIASGTVAVERNGQRINTLGPGAVVGEMSLISEGPRTATIRTLEPCRLFVAAHREFHSLMDVHPTIRLRILEGLAMKIRALDLGSVH
jgi:CRP-like cAMP-binding protein